MSEVIGAVSTSDILAGFWSLIIILVILITSYRVRTVLSRLDNLGNEMEELSAKLDQIISTISAR